MVKIANLNKNYKTRICIRGGKNGDNVFKNRTFTRKGSRKKIKPLPRGSIWNRRGLTSTGRLSQRIRPSGLIKPKS